MRASRAASVVSMTISYRMEGAPAALPRAPGSAALAVRATRCWLTMYRRTWRGSVWSATLGPLFYLGAMGYGLGSLVDARGTGALGGVSYVVFVAPAVLGVQAMNTGLSLSLYPVFGSLRWNAVYLAARATPLRPADICRGHLLFNALRLAMSSAFFIVVMAALGLIRSPWAALLLPAAVLTGLAFSAVTMPWSVMLKSESSLSYPIRFGAIPLMLFSGTFFPVTRLPEWIRPVAYATPLWHGVALCRSLSLGTVFASTGDAVSAFIHVAYLAALTGLGVWLAGRMYRRRLYV